MPIQKVNREIIINKSLDVFRQNGYHNTSMADLAEAVGLFKGSFYHYFDSKETLMREILLMINLKFKEYVLPEAYNETILPMDRLKLVFKLFGKTLFSPKGGCIVGNMTLETVQLYPQFRDILIEIFDGWIAALKHIYASKYSEETALKLAQQTIMEFEGAVMMTKLYGEGNFYLDCYNRALDRISDKSIPEIS
jgi:AcrR family transcriptional regulator